MANQNQQIHNGHVFHQIPVFKDPFRPPGLSPRRPYVLRARYEGDIPLDVVRGSMVAGVREAPGVVGDEQERMEEEPAAVVECVRGR